MKKKALKIIGVLFVLIVIGLFTLPYLFQNNIADLIKRKVNSTIDATFDFEEAKLSLFSSFPNANLELTNISIRTKTPFEGDTLLSAKNVALTLPIGDLFNGASAPITVNDFTIDQVLVNIQVDRLGNANYDITKPDTAQNSSTNTGDQDNFVFSLTSYAISNATILYRDETTGIDLHITEMMHNGSGNLSASQSQLKTQTEALMSFSLDSTRYLNKNSITLDALIGIDLSESKYSFLENTAMVNQLPLIFDGFVQLFEDYTEVAINFKTASSDFKNFLAVIPEAYVQNIEEVKTSGNFEVIGNFEGRVDDTYIPKFDITMQSNDASFKYPELPKSVEHVMIDTRIANETGRTADTYVAITKVSFSIEEDAFELSARINELLGNPKIDATLNGHLNLGNIAQAYPVPSSFDLSGNLKANVTTSFDMASVTKKQYERTKTMGDFTLTNFIYNSDELSSPVNIKNSTLNFNPETVQLKEFNGTMGQSDFKASGIVHNVLGFLFNEENVKGNFELKSTTFAVNDFMVDGSTTTETEEDINQEETPQVNVQIPNFLDCTIKATAETVLYDNVVLKNVSGDLRIKDQKAVLSNMTSSVFDGKLAFNGEVSTKAEVPTFAMALDMDNLKIAETFKALSLFKALAPIAGAIEGRLNSTIEIAGDLKEDFTPNLASLSGDVLTQLRTAKINPKESGLLTTLDNNLNFVQINELNAQDIKAILSFEDGKVNVKPFQLNYQDIGIEVAGNHTFDQKMNYGVTFNVPAKYLGTEVNSLIAKIDDTSLEDLSVPITASIAGSYTSPSVNTDLGVAIKKLTAQLVELQKQKLVAEGKDKASAILGDLLNKNKKNTDSSETSQNNTVNQVLGTILGGKDKAADSLPSKTDTTVSEKDNAVKKASSLLGGILKKKKKKDTVN